MVEAEVQVSGTVDPGMREKQILTYGHRDGQGRELAPVVRRITVLDKTRENEKQELKSRILTLEKRLEQLTNAKTWPKTLVTLQAKPRMVRLLPRGNWLDDSGPIMQPAIPTFLGKLDLGESRATRLDLARWIASRDNPLTARVFVNRVWKQFFGKGLARDLDDLGAQGERPTHPKLLDWLAVDFGEIRAGPRRGTLPSWNLHALAQIFLASQPASIRRPSPRRMRGGTAYLQHSTTGPCSTK